MGHNSKSNAHLKKKTYVSLIMIFQAIFFDEKKKLCDIAKISFKSINFNFPKFFFYFAKKEKLGCRY